MFCRHCGNEIADQAAICVKCGVATSNGPEAAVRVGGRAKGTYVLLGVLLGLFGFPGIHNFYAGYTGKGLAQILCSILTCWILWLPMYIWTIVEVCTVTIDADGNPMV